MHCFLDLPAGFAGSSWRGLVLLAQAQNANGGEGVWGLFSSPMLPMFVTLIVLYFVMIIAPQRKKQKETDKLLSGLKKNDHVVTIGGICGTVVAAVPSSKFITLRIDDSSGTKIRILRSAVSYVGGPEDSETDGKSGE